jgi:hypothetical protein
VEDQFFGPIQADLAADGEFANRLRLAAALDRGDRGNRAAKLMQERSDEAEQRQQRQPNAAAHGA